MHPLAETLLDEPVIAAVKTDDALTAALASPCSTVFLLASTLLNVGELVRRIHAAGKLAVVHIDLVDGLSAREVAVNSLIALCHPDGIISTHPSLIRRARHQGLLTIQRAFILDSLSLNNLSGQLEQGKPDFVEILPGIITGMIMAFTLSLDDFVISYFTQGSGFQTLPIRIYNMTKKTVTPKMYALATIIFFVILALLLLTNLVDEDDTQRIRDARRAKRAGKPARAKRSGSGRRPVRAAVGILTAAALLIAGISIYSSRQETRVLNVYNWGEYISDGSDDSLDTIAAFEDWYKATYGVPVKVNYDTYASNEDMYAKLKSGAVSYDVVIPSDYMIARMEAEDMLLPLNYDNIPNYQYISEDFRGLYYDPDDTYTVPYTYGIVGVIYNANVVDEADTGSWDLMWNPKYAGNILQFNNARDALGTAMYRAGIDVNTTDHADWQQALQALVDQRPLVKSYVMDEIYNMMESGEAAVAAYYAGDYFTMCDAQADSVDLQFYYPENTNYFIDAMCIPTSCRDQELAECFINFMLSREAAVANAEYIYYASPNRLVYDDPEYIDDMGEDTMAILYPDIGSFRDAYNRSAYRNLDQDTLTYVNSLWETLKIN